MPFLAKLRFVISVTGRIPAIVPLLIMSDVDEKAQRRHEFGDDKTHDPSRSSSDHAVVRDANAERDIIEAELEEHTLHRGLK